MRGLWTVQQSRRRRMEGLGILSIAVPLGITVVLEVYLLIRGPFDYRGRLGEIFTVYFGVVGVTSAILAHAAMADLHVKIRHLVEMSLQPLNSFGEVLSKAYTLISRAEGELYFVSLVASFGTIHTCNETVVSGFERSLRLSGRPESFAEAIESFSEELYEKVCKLEKVTLLLLNVNRLKGVLDDLGKREGYEELDVNKVLEVEKKKRQELVHALVRRRTKKADGAKCQVSAMLPEQVLIARMLDHFGETVYGCLVFLVGSELPRRERTVGYYIEAKEIASIYMAFVDSLAEDGEGGLLDLEEEVRGFGPQEARVAVAEGATR